MSNFVRIAGSSAVNGISFMSLAGIYKQSSPLSQFLLIMFLLITLLIFSTLLGLLMLIPFYGVSIVREFSTLTNYTDPRVISLLKYFQIVNQLGILVLPPVLFAWLVDRVPFQYLRADKKPDWRNLLLAILLIFTSMPLIGWLVELNEAMHLPSWLPDLEAWMKSSEANAAKITEAFFTTGSIWGLLLNMLMIAVLPAIGEEFLFRGVFMRVFIRWLKNNHAGIWIAAFLFSAIHMQFYGFFPRLLLGAAFGYIFIWTGNIWIPVAAHFVQNATSVMVAWLAGRGIISASADDFGQSDNIFIIAASAICIALLLVVIYKSGKIRAVNGTANPDIEIS